MNEVSYLTPSIATIHFFYNSVIISPEHLKRSICQGNCVYFTTPVATIHIITNGLCFTRVKLNDMFIWGKPSSPCSFKGAYLFPRISYGNICLKSAMLNALKYLRSPHRLLVNVLICNFTTVISAIH